MHATQICVCSKVVELHLNMMGDDDTENTQTVQISFNSEGWKLRTLLNLTTTFATAYKSFSHLFGLIEIVS